MPAVDTHAHDDFFYILPENIHGNTLTVRGDENHHLTRVLRKRTDALFWAVDGLGHTFECQITRIHRDFTEARILQTLANQREPGVHLALAVSVPKKAKFEWIVEKGTEIGVSEFLPMLTAHSVAGTPSQQHRQRLKKIALSAMKQCKRSRLPGIAETQPFEAVCRLAPDFDVALIAHEKELSLSIPKLADDEKQWHAKRSALLCIGPEGGFTEEEIAFARTAGFAAVTLGPRRLRTETAAIAAAAILLSQLRQLE